MIKEYFAGLDLGGTQIKVGLCTPDGNEIWSDRFPSNASMGQEAILKALEDARRLPAKTNGLGTFLIHIVGLK